LFTARLNSFTTRHYTPEQGRISVQVNSDPVTASVEVADTGKGIAAEDIPRIFDRFFRGRETSCEEPEGAGLGLAIVKMIAEMHGGRIEVTSCPEKGSTFTLHIPRSRSRDSHDNTKYTIP